MDFRDYDTRLAAYALIVEDDEPLVVHSFTEPTGHGSPRPFKSLRVVFRASVTGGTLDTPEVGGTTDFADWVPLDGLEREESRADIVDVAVSARRSGPDGG